MCLPITLLFSSWFVGMNRDTCRELRPMGGDGDFGKFSEEQTPIMQRVKA